MKHRKQLMRINSVKMLIQTMIMLSNIVVKRNGAGPKLKLSPINQLFLFMAWLRCGLPLFHLVFLFKKKKTTIFRYLITWSNYLYFTSGSIPIWLTKQQIADSMPDCFKNTYPSTRGIIDCTALSYMFKFLHCWPFRVPYIPLISIAALIKAYLVFLHLVL